MFTSSDNQNVIDAASEYIRRGFFVAPIPHCGIRPVLTGWPDLRITENELEEYFQTAGGIGLLLSPSGLADVDCDCPEAVAAARILLPQSEMVHGHASNPASHHYFRASGMDTNGKFSDPRRSRDNRATIIEIRVNGQTIVPPSINRRSGEPVLWERKGEPANIDGLLLLKRVKQVAAAALIARYWPNGVRHDASMALAGMLFGAGWLDLDIHAFVSAVISAAHDEEGASRLRDIGSTARRFGQHLPATGAPTLREIIGPDIVNKVCEWLELSTAGGTAESSVLHLSDLGNAKRLVLAHGKDLRFELW